MTGSYNILEVIYSRAKPMLLLHRTQVRYMLQSASCMRLATKTSETGRQHIHLCSQGQVNTSNAQVAHDSDDFMARGVSSRLIPYQHQLTKLILGLEFLSRKSKASGPFGKSPFGTLEFHSPSLVVGLYLLSSCS